MTAIGTPTSQAGSFTAGASSDIATDTTGIQYIRQSARAASFAFTWTPPPTNVGNVTMYLVVYANSSLYASTYTLTPATGGTTNTLTLNPTMLTFSANGATAPSPQMLNATSSGSSIAFNTSASTTDGAAWLSTLPSGGMTGTGTSGSVITVSINPSVLTSTNTYMGKVTVTPTSATISPQSVTVTLNYTAGTTTSSSLMLSPTTMTFTSTDGSMPASQPVTVTSTGSPLAFSTSVTSGSSWLSITPSTGGITGTAGAMPMVSVSPPSGLSAGTHTYAGSVMFTSAGASNSPQTLPVTLNVTVSGTPPPTGSGPLTYSFHVIDKQSGGTDRLLADGQGAVDSSGNVTGGGSFTRYYYSSGGHAESEDGSPSTRTMGTWKATGYTSYTPAASGHATSGGDDGGGSGNGGEGSSGGGSGGILQITVQLSTAGEAAASELGTMKIASTGSDSGVTLSFGGATFVPSGVGRVSIRAGSSGGGDGGNGGTVSSGGSGGRRGGERKGER